jgi:hypothetical protein
MGRVCQIRSPIILGPCPAACLPEQLARPPDFFFLPPLLRETLSRFRLAGFMVVVVLVLVFCCVLTSVNTPPQTHTQGRGACFERTRCAAAAEATPVL